jgi:hypothetical protein
MPKQQQNSFLKEFLFVGSLSVTKLLSKNIFSTKDFSFYKKRPKV